MLSQAGSDKHHNFYYTSAVWPIHFDRFKTQKVEVRVSSWIRTHWVLTTSFNANRGLFISCTTTCSEQRQTRQAFAFLEKWRRTREIASTVWQGRKINRVAGIIFNWTIPKNTECYELAVVYLCVYICVFSSGTDWLPVPRRSRSSIFPLAIRRWFTRPSIVSLARSIVTIIVNDVATFPRRVADRARGN